MDYTQVPLDVSRIQIEYLEGTSIIGIIRVTVNLSAGQSLTLNDLNFDPVGSRLTTLEIEPRNLTLAPGVQGQLRAVGRLEDGQVLDVTNSVIWSSTSAKLQISESGTVSSLSAGTYGVTARFGSQTATTVVTVRSTQLSDIRIEPSSVGLPLGSTGNVEVKAIFTDGGQQTVTPEALLAVSPPDLASIDSTGLVTASRVGSGTIKATYNSQIREVPITVTDAQLKTIVITPTGTTIPKGLSRTFSADGIYTDNTRKNLDDQVTWSTSQPVVAQIAQNGVCLGRNTGTTKVEATLGSISGSVDTEVTAAVISRLNLIPDTNLPLGLTQQLTAIAIFSDGSSIDVTDQGSYSSSDSSIVSVTTLAPRGITKAHKLGDATITCSFSGEQASVDIRSTDAVLEELTLNPTSLALPVGLTSDVTAQGRYSDGSLKNLTNNVMWRSTSPTFADVDSGGRVVAISEGSASIEATLSGKSVSIPAVISAAAVRTVKVTPTSLTLADGKQFQLKAEATYTDGNILNVTQTATWAPDTSGSVSVTNLGLVEALNQGTGLVRASLQGITGEASVEVIPSGSGQAFFPGVSTGKSGRNFGIGDLNGDGYPDTASVESQFPEISIFFNNSKGLLKTEMTIPLTTGSRPQEVLVGDLTGDSVSDIVVTESPSNRISVYINQGNGTFSPRLSYQLSTGAMPTSLQLWDVDSDNDLDLVGSDGSVLTGRFVTLVNDGAGNFTTERVRDLNRNRPGPYVHRDVDGVNGDDIIWYDSDDDDLILLPNDGAGGFASEVVLLDNFSLKSFQVDDWDLDGDMDLVVSNFDPSFRDKVEIFLNNGSLSFSSSQSFVPGPNVRFGPSRDLNGDNASDIVAFTQNSPDIYVFINKTDGSFEDPVTLRGAVRELAVADFNQDGNPDIAGASSDGPLIHFNRDGFKNAPLDIEEDGSGIHSHVAGDFDGDGDLDLATVSFENNLHRVILNDGLGNLSFGGSFQSESRPYAVTSGDYNGDGNADLAVVNSSSFTQTVSVSLATGNGSFAPRRDYSTGATGIHIISGDFNLDGHIDLAVPRLSEDDVLVLYNNGSGVFNSTATFPAGDGPRVVAAFDVDGDSDLDLVTGSTVDSRVNVLKNRGDGTFESPMVFNSGHPIPFTLKSADIDGDGDLDLAVGHNQDTTVIMVNDGTGSFQPGSTVAGTNKIVFGDFDGDGDQDIWAGVLSLNDGNGNFGDVTYFQYSNGRSYQTGDFDNDGDLDISVVGQYEGNNRDFLSIMFNLPLPPSN